jgi:hypothetical protein
MKRKSILMTIVAVFFAGVTWGQNWPTSHGTGVVDSDTIFFCVRTDSLYPIELGYDVSGRRLHPSYGEWKLISKTDATVVAADYDLGIPNGNDGAGNAFKTVGSGVGGLLFEYLAQDKQCGLDLGEKFWVYVFILPDFHDIVNPGDTIICYEKGGSPIDIKFDQTFDKYVDLYKAAGFTFGTSPWKHGGSFKIRKDSIATYSLSDTIVFATKPLEYTCGEPVVFKLVARVDSMVKLGPIALSKCTDDTLGDLGNRTPNEVFNRNSGGNYYTGNSGTDPITKLTPFTGALTGSYTTTINDSYGTRTVTTVWKAYRYHYRTCNPADANEYADVYDTLYISDGSPAPNSYWGKDTIVYCRDTSAVDIFKLYYDSVMGYPSIPGAKPGLTQSSSYWRDRDLGQSYANGRFPFPPYSTKDGKSSLGIEVTGTFSRADTIASYEKSGYSVNLDILKSNVAYHYLWTVDAAAFPCFTNKDGVPDSGTMVVILQDPAIAQDYTAQLCKSSYSGGFNLNVYAGLNVTWQPVGSPALTNNVLNVPSTSFGTYKYKYSIPAKCGPGGDGVFYIKVGSNVKVPTSKEVKYCIDKLPASINLNDVLGVGIEPLTWSSSDGLGTGDGFETNAGTLDISKYVSSKGSKAETLTFVTNNAAACGVNAVTLKITFVTTL